MLQKQNDILYIIMVTLRKAARVTEMHCTEVYSGEVKIDINHYHEGSTIT